jgi:O-acetyl-ADP-ribose deacetylase (regulator of RNase III)
MRQRQSSPRMKIEIVVGNIVAQPDADAIVNSANANLRLGSGVAGAIHTAAGPELAAFCRPFAPLAEGSALIAPGFNLPNPWVIHVVAASFVNNPHADEILEQALESMMKVANANNIKSIAMPAIGTGIFRCPAELSALLTARVLSSYARHGSCVEWVRICVAREAIRSVFSSATLAASEDSELAINRAAFSFTQGIQFSRRP